MLNRLTTVDAGRTFPRMIENESQLQSTAAPRSRAWTWARRVAAVGFLFFLVKGLVWVGLGIVVAMQVF